MKMTARIFSIFLLLIMVVSCATTPHTIPEKYNLDNEFEAIDRVYAPNNSSWEKVDNQSVILRTNLTDYYLLVLSRPMYGRMYIIITEYSQGIFHNGEGYNITPGINWISAKSAAGIDDYIIEKIYKLEGKEQAEEIRERLRKS